MEENTKTSFKRTSILRNTEPIKQAPQAKINQLHQLIQGYLLNCNRKKIESLLPSIYRVQNDIQKKQKQLSQLQLVEVTEKQLASLYELKKKLTQELKQIAKKVEIVKNAVKAKRIQRKQIQQQEKKNQQIYRQLELRNNQVSQKRAQVTKKASPIKVKPAFPRISGFNYQLHHANPMRKDRLTGSLINGSSTGRSCDKGEEKEKESIYNSINYHRIKEVEKLIDDITVNCASFKFEKLLTGNPKHSIVKKVFKNFSIKEYFDQFLLNKTVFKFLEKIQKQ